MLFPVPGRVVEKQSLVGMPHIEHVCMIDLNHRILDEALQWTYENEDPDGLPNDDNLLYTVFGPQAQHRGTYL